MAHEYWQGAEQRCQELHNLPVGSFTEQDWRDAHNLMGYWCREKGTRHPIVPKAVLAETVPLSLDFLERLLHEQQAQNSKHIPFYWLKTITNNWKQVYRKQSPAKRKENSFYNALRFLEKAEHLGSLGALQLHTRIYTTVMDAALRQDRLNNNPLPSPRRAHVATKEMKETAEFVESLLERMQAASLKPDQFAYTTVIKAWEWVGDGPRARRILQKMCDLYDQGQDELEPNRESFLSVLKAFARGPKFSGTIGQCCLVIEQMQDYHAHNGLDTLPQGGAFNALLTCLLHNPYIEDPMGEAEKNFQEIPAEYISSITYNIMLEMYSKRGMDKKAASLLQQMIREYEQTGEERLAPNVESFNLVLSALTKAGNHGAVEEHFRLMEELHANNILRGVAPDQVTYSILLDNWAQQVGRVPDACARVDAIFHTMKRIAEQGNHSVRPNKATYTTVINAFAKDGNARRAEELLGEMLEEPPKKQDRRPDRAAFNSVLLALSRSDQHDAPSRIRALMQQMEEISSNRRSGEGYDIQPDVRSYNFLLQAIARSGQRDAGEQCERILEKMQMQANPQRAPNAISYVIVVQAYGKAGRAEQAERILEQVCDEYYKQGKAAKPNTKLKPSVQLFSAVMNAWSRRKNPERAEALLKTMKELSAAGDLAGSIDTTAFNSVMDAWSNSCRRDSGERAEAILQEMESVSGIAPNTISYNTAMKAWSALGNTDRCENLFNRMRELPEIYPGYVTLCTLLTAWSRSTNVESDDDRAEIVLKKLNELQETSGIVPNIACYNVVLDCLSKASKEESCLAAEGLLNEMENLASQDFGSPSLTVRPNVVSYSSVIHAFANTGDAEKAEMILERMIKEFVRSKERRLCPTTQCFNTVLKAWAQKCRKSPSPDAPARAEALLARMRRLHNEFGVPVKPDVISFNTLIDVWGNSGVANCQNQVLAILQGMIASRDPDIAPTTISYNTAISAFGPSGHFENAEWLLQDWYEAYNRKQALSDDSMAKPNLISWNSLLSVYAKSHSNSAADRAESAIEKMEELYSAGVLEARPDTLSYNCLMHSLAKSSTSDAGVRCESIIEEMESRWASGDRSVKPDFRSYGAAIQAWLRRNNFEAARALLNKMCTAHAGGDMSMKPSLETCQKLLQASDKKGDATAGGEIQQQMKELYPHVFDVDQQARGDGSRTMT